MRMIFGSAARAAILTSVAGAGVIGAAGVAPAATAPAPAVSVASASWSSASHGWALGFRPCKAGRCTVLLRTTDGAKHWKARTAPPVKAPQGGDEVHVLFADDKDGLATDGLRLFATHDGAAHWKRAALPAGVRIVDLAAGGKAVYAVVVGKSGARLMTSPAHRTGWRAVKGIALAGTTNGTLSTRGAQVAVSLGGYTEPTRYWTSADGRTWRNHAPACGANEVTELGVAPGDTVLALCSSDPGFGSMTKVLNTSVRGGPFTSTGEAPRPGYTQDFATASRTTAVIAAVDSKRAASFLHATFDGGKTWQTPLAVTDQDRPLGDLAFQDAEHGVVVIGWQSSGDTGLFRTADGGHTWKRLTVR